MANLCDCNSLNMEFNCMLDKFECSFANLDFREKSIATEWITKLKNTNATIEEMRLRNAFMAYFVKSACCGLFSRKPFNNIPPSHETLQCLRHLLPKDYLRSPENKNRQALPDLFASMPDKGAFLSKQPVPRSGTFMIMLLNTN